jgi:asparagine synthase (glutamine-hydrolysing)
MQTHRGPDSSGIHLDQGVGLGIRRLRVIDLDTGDQPLFNEDGSVTVVLNGEIYNYRELRAGLERRGHRFSSKGDTEVIAHLYEDLGTDCVRELDGMFAFAIWDSRRRRLFLARDRVGKKPLVYCRQSGRLSFASEIRALLQDPDVPRDLDRTALDLYLTYEYIPAPRSAFRAVRKLPPGSTLLYEDGEVSIDRYWELSYDGDGSGAEAADLREELRQRIRAAVRRRLISDVPLGALLSGGIDSSAVVAAMAEASPGPVKTFSIGFPDQEHNELPNARLVAERFGTDHHELVIEPDALSILPTIVRHHGEPFADRSAVPNFLVAELTRRHVTVALNGDGGDEAFAGYDRYVEALRMERLAGRLPGPLRRAMGATSENGAQSFRPVGTLARARRGAHALSLPTGERYELAMSTFAGAERRRLYTPEFLDFLDGSAEADPIREVWRAAGEGSLVNRMLEVDFNTYLPDDLLVKMDIATMAYSLEARSPFLDRELVEFVASLPGERKLHGHERKAILRDALRGWIPDQILDGPKRGFGMPMAAQWFRGELREQTTELLTDSRAASRGYFRPDTMHGLLDRHLAGREENSAKLWTLMMFELWHREFVDDPAPALSPAHA